MCISIWVPGEAAAAGWGPNKAGLRGVFKERLGGRNLYFDHLWPLVIPGSSQAEDAVEFRWFQAWPLKV